ncbi:hypothetical protein R6Q57_016236 [Mikania cordata]
MVWRELLLSLSFTLALAESRSRSSLMSSIKLGAEHSFLYNWTIFSSSFCVLVALILSMYLIFEHLSSYNQPEEQKFLIGLILMVPVYALESFLSLLDSDAAFNYEIIRDCYEAFALYCFERYLIACLGGEDNTIKFMESKSLISSSIPLIEESYTYGIVEHPFPLNFMLREWYLGPDFYQAVKIGIVQYMILKLICGLLAMLFQFLGVYGEGKFEWGYANGELVEQMAVAAVVHLYVFPAAPYKRGERCVRNVAVMSDYASLGTEPAPDEVWDSERTAKVRFGDHDDVAKRMKLHQSVRDVVVGSGEIIVDDMKFTVSQVVEPVERGIAKINKTFHEISKNVKRHEERIKSSKDDSYVIPLNSWTKEFIEVNDNIVDGSFSDSGISEGRGQRRQLKASSFHSNRR